MSEVRIFGEILVLLALVEYGIFQPFNNWTMGVFLNRSPLLWWYRCIFIIARATGLLLLLLYLGTFSALESWAR